MKVRNILFLVLASLLLCTAVSAAEYTDVSDTHWAYKQIDYLSAEITGYPDGYFHGDRTMTRYEYAQMLYKALQKGAYVDQDTLDEYAPELAQINMQNQ